MNTKTQKPQSKNKCFRVPVFSCFCEKERGFTLIEILVVISIIGFLASMSMYYFNAARVKARDTERVHTLNVFRKALELYYDEHDKYLSINQTSSFTDWTNGFRYREYSGGSCGSLLAVNINNSSSSGFLSELYPDYMSASDWRDPLDPPFIVDPGPPIVYGESPFNCRYVVPRSEIDPAGDGNGEGFRDDANVQHYLLHCKLELNPDLMQNDGGFNDNFYEVQIPEQWVCVEHITD